MSTKRKQIKRPSRRARSLENRDPRNENVFDVYKKSKLTRKITRKGSFHDSKRLPLWTPKKAAKELERYLQLANLKLPQADALEEPPKPPSLSEAAERERSAEGQGLTKYDELVRIVQHTRNAALFRAKREQFAHDLVRDISAALSMKPQEILPQYHVGFTEAEGSELELYELRHFVQGAFSSMARNVSLGGADAAVGRWRVGVSHVYDIDSKGRISVNLGAWGPFENALKSIDARRVQRCSVCEKYFYAPRANQSFCSKQCGRTARMRRWREKQKRLEQRRNE